MKTTLLEIKKHGPCEAGWSKLLKGLNKTEEDNEPLGLMQILRSNGIKDAVWALRCFHSKDYGMFLSDVAESVLDIYKAKYPAGNRPEKNIKAIRDYCSGLISKEDLKDAVDAVADPYINTAASYVADATFHAVYAAYTDYGMYAYVTATEAADAAYAVAAADDVEADYATYAATRQDKWDEIESLFIKHFKEDIEHPELEPGMRACRWHWLVSLLLTLKREALKREI